MAKHIEIPGQLGIDPATGRLVGEKFEAQTAQALENIALRIKEKGRRVDDIVAIDVYRTSKIPQGYERYHNAGNRIHANRLYDCFLRPYGGFLRKYLSQDNLNYRPARTFVEVDVLPSMKKGEYLPFTKTSPRVEIVARAIIKSNKEYHQPIELEEGVSSPEKYTPHGVVVDLGSRLYVETSGQLGREPFPSFENMRRGFLDQPAQAFLNIKSILDSIGGELADVTDLRIYTTEDEIPGIPGIESLIKTRLKSRTHPYGLANRDLVQVIRVVDIPKRIVGVWNGPKVREGEVREHFVSDTDPAWVSISARAMILKKDIRRREKEIEDSY